MVTIFCKGLAKSSKMGAQLRTSIKSTLRQNDQSARARVFLDAHMGGKTHDFFQCTSDTFGGYCEPYDFCCAGCAVQHVKSFNDTVNELIDDISERYKTEAATSAIQELNSLRQKFSVGAGNVNFNNCENYWRDCILGCRALDPDKISSAAMLRTLFSTPNDDDDDDEYLFTPRVWVPTGDVDLEREIQDHCTDKVCTTQINDRHVVMRGPDQKACILGCRISYDIAFNDQYND